jgi:hypothetical protein
LSFQLQQCSEMRCRRVVKPMAQYTKIG